MRHVGRARDHRAHLRLASGDRPALERLARGEKPIPAGISYEDVDPWNARFAEAKARVSTADILAELDASHAYFMQEAKAVDDARLVPEKTAYKLVDLNSRHHYQSHADEIAAWRKSRGYSSRATSPVRRKPRRARGSLPIALALVAPQLVLDRVDQRLPRRLDDVVGDADRAPGLVAVARGDQHARFGAGALGLVQDADLVVEERHLLQFG